MYKMEDTMTSQKEDLSQIIMMMQMLINKKDTGMRFSPPPVSLIRLVPQVAMGHKPQEED